MRYVERHVNQHDAVQAAHAHPWRLGAVTRLAKSLPWWAPVAIVLALTSPLTVYWWGLVAAGSVAFDWRIFVEAGERFWAGSPNLYEVTELYSFRHSPVLAMAMPAVALVGTIGIRLITLAGALALPTWPMRLAAVASWPFAMDLQHGALIMVIVLAAVWGLRGSRIGAIAFMLLTFLSPRPMMVPIAVLLLWRQPAVRLPALAAFVAHAAVVFATGYGEDWAQLLLSAGTDGIESPFNLSPSQLIGRLWIPVGLGLAVFLTIRGRAGLAALAINPYVLPHYLLLLLLEVPRETRQRAPHERSVPEPKPLTA